MVLTAQCLPRGELVLTGEFGDVRNKRRGLFDAKRSRYSSAQRGTGAPTGWGAGDSGNG